MTLLTANLDLTITEDGPSESFGFQAGDHWLIIRCEEFGSVTLQMSPDDTEGSFADVKDFETGDSVVITENWNYPVAGGVYYRLNVTEFNSDYIVKSRRATRS
jgi:hypothetical protein